MPELLERLRAGLSDRYAIEREIGSGGMARVFLAQDVKHRRPVAIKVLRPEVGGSLGGERFLREIEFAAKLSHPHVLPLHDSGETDGLLYYVMPFVEGESLRDRLKREKQLPVLEALRITSEAADALAYAHAHGIVHRDIKPENILLSAGHAVVSDFGIARAVSAAAGDRLTVTGIAIGTVYYMSPEQAVGDTVIDGRSDIYSLGCVLYEMLAGEPPFAAPTPQAVMARRFAESSPNVSDIRGDLPVEVERALTQSLAKDADDRFPTAEQFVAALSDATGAIQARTRTGPRAVGVRPLVRRRKVVAAAAGVLVLGAAWLLGWQLTRGDSLVREAHAANRVAVLPFTVHGGQHLAYLSEGIVDLLSRNLEGVDDLRSIDPGTIILAVKSETKGEPVVDDRMRRSIVRRVGAGAFIAGSVNAIGSRVRIQAALYRAAEAEPTSASVEGDTTDLLALVDQLSAQLLVNRPGAQRRLTRTAALTTPSLPALKSFLNAEHHLRAGTLDSAIAGFQHAIVADSTFALAYYRLGVAAGWAERHALSTDAVTKGAAIRGRLNERDRRLITAYLAYRRGDATNAERLYRQILDDAPDDVEAEFQLGDVLYQYNPLRGRPRLEARPLLDRVLSYDPGFL